MSFNLTVRRLEVTRNICGLLAFWCLLMRFVTPVGETGSFKVYFFTASGIIGSSQIPSNQPPEVGADAFTTRGVAALALSSVATALVGVSLFIFVLVPVQKYKVVAIGAIALAIIAVLASVGISVGSTVTFNEEYLLGGRNSTINIYSNDSMYKRSILTPYGAAPDAEFSPGPAVIFSAAVVSILVLTAIGIILYIRASSRGQSDNSAKEIIGDDASKIAESAPFITVQEAAQPMFGPVMVLCEGEDSLNIAPTIPVDVAPEVCERTAHFLKQQEAGIRDLWKGNGQAINQGSSRKSSNELNTNNQNEKDESRGSFSSSTGSEGNTSSERHRRHRQSSSRKSVGIRLSNSRLSDKQIMPSSRPTSQNRLLEEESGPSSFPVRASNSRFSNNNFSQNRFAVTSPVTPSPPPQQQQQQRVSQNQFVNKVYDGGDGQLNRRGEDSQPHFSVLSPPQPPLRTSGPMVRPSSDTSSEADAAAQHLQAAPSPPHWASVLATFGVNAGLVTCFALMVLGCHYPSAWVPTGSSSFDSHLAWHYYYSVPEIWKSSLSLLLTCGDLAGALQHAGIVYSLATGLTGLGVASACFVHRRSTRVSAVPVLSLMLAAAMVVESTFLLTVDLEGKATSGITPPRFLTTTTTAPMPKPNVTVLLANEASTALLNGATTRQGPGLPPGLSPTIGCGDQNSHFDVWITPSLLIGGGSFIFISAAATLSIVLHRRLMASWGSSGALFKSSERARKHKESSSAHLTSSRSSSSASFSRDAVAGATQKSARNRNA